MQPLTLISDRTRGYKRNLMISSTVFFFASISSSATPILGRFSLPEIMPSFHSPFIIGLIVAQLYFIWMFFVVFSCDLKVSRSQRDFGSDSRYRHSCRFGLADASEVLPPLVFGAAVLILFLFRIV